jgi:hypothetical protein
LNKNSRYRKKCKKIIDLELGIQWTRMAPEEPLIKHMPVLFRKITSPKSQKHTMNYFARLVSRVAQCGGLQIHHQVQNTKSMANLNNNANPLSTEKSHNRVYSLLFQTKTMRNENTNKVFRN